MEVRDVDIPAVQTPEPKEDVYESMDFMHVATVTRVRADRQVTLQGNVLSDPAVRPERKRGVTFHEQVPDTHYYYG
jgi:hypothetical protein